MPLVTCPQCGLEQQVADAGAILFCIRCCPHSLKAALADMVQVLRPGAEVIVFGGPVGVVLAVMIEHQGAVSYKVGWLHGDAYEEKWLPDHVVESGQTKELVVGFRVEKR